MKNNKPISHLTRFLLFAVLLFSIGASAPLAALAEPAAAEEEVLGSVSFLLRGMDNKPISGAVFGLFPQGSDSPAAEAVSDENGQVLFSGIPCGTYTLRETQVPMGFLPIRAFRVTVRPTHPDVVLRRQINSTEDRGGLTIQAKAANNTLRHLSGAEFNLYLVNRYTNERELYNEKPYVTGRDGVLTIGMLPYGTYYLEQVKAPEGFALAAEPVTGPYVLSGRTSTTRYPYIPVLYAREVPGAKTEEKAEETPAPAAEAPAEEAKAEAPAEEAAAAEAQEEAPAEEAAAGAAQPAEEAQEEPAAEETEPAEEEAPVEEAAAEEAAPEEAQPAEEAQSAEEAQEEPAAEETEPAGEEAPAEEAAAEEAAPEEAQPAKETQEEPAAEETEPAEEEAPAEEAAAEEAAPEEAQPAEEAQEEPAAEETEPAEEEAPAEEAAAEETVPEEAQPAEEAQEEPAAGEDELSAEEASAEEASAEEEPAPVQTIDEEDTGAPDASEAERAQETEETRENGKQGPFSNPALLLGGGFAAVIVLGALAGWFLGGLSFVRK